ncbi:MAG: hypothetical protein Q8P95_03445 [bacterium]|nr:hypothetical protein [bacterium]
MQEDLPDTVQQNDCDRIAQQFSDESLARYARMACLQQVAEEQGRELLEMFKK